MTYICDVIFCVSIMEVFSHVFRYQFFFFFFFGNLSKHLKLIVECECFFENITRNRRFAHNKKSGAHFNKRIAAYRERGLINRERKSITDDPEEKRNTDDSKRTVSLRNLKRTLSLRSLRSFRTVNDFGPQKIFL